MEKRYKRSLDTVTEEELALIQSKTVGVVGAGGLGGYVIEMLARFGFGKIKIIDGDVFDESNLNRQVLSTEDNLGLWKVDIAKSHVHQINSNVDVEVIKAKYNQETAVQFTEDLDIIIDCVDNVSARLLMEQMATRYNIPLIHGAVGAWIGQVITILPGDYVLKDIYQNGEINMPVIGAAAFIPATVASYQVAECVKVITGKGEILHKKMLYFDVLENDIFVVELKNEE